MFPEIRTAIFWMVAESLVSLAACSSDSRQGEDWQFTFDATTDDGDGDSAPDGQTDVDTRDRSDVGSGHADVVPDVDSPSDSAC